MLYVIYGTDSTKARAKTHELLESLQKKRPDASLFELNEESLTDSLLDELIGGQGLFSSKYIVFCDSVMRGKESKEVFLGKIKEIGMSENVFISLEGGLDATTLKKLEKNSAKVQEYEGKKEVKKESFNMFSLTDALGSRDRKSLWVLYRKAVDSGAVSEEIHGVLFWQVKSMLLALASKDAKEAGLNPFVYSKAKGFARNWSETELKDLSLKLVSLYHDAHRGEIDFEVEMEKMVITV